MFVDVDYSDIYSEAAQESWIAEVIEWAHTQGLDPDEYDHEQMDKLESEYREIQEMKRGWLEEQFYMLRSR